MTQPMFEFKNDMYTFKELFGMVYWAYLWKIKNTAI